jgi:hypothetical protein
MLPEEAVRARLAKLEQELTTVRALWHAATSAQGTQARVEHHSWDNDPQLLRGHMTALESAIEELRIVLGESA